jgi:hypothetical protein
MPEQDYRRLLFRTLVAIAVCIAAVLVCYFLVDRPVAFFVYHHHINNIKIFRWLTYPPPEVQNWSPLMLAVLMVRRAWGPFARWQKVLLVACLSLILADEFRMSLGDVLVATGRRPGPTIIHRSSAPARTVSIRFSAETTSAVFRLAMPPGSSASPWCG